MVPFFTDLSIKEKVTERSFAAPSLSLATNRMVQNGRAVARSVKYANMSLMLNHKSYSSFVVPRAIIS